MPLTLTPLRYPGGKTQLAKFVVEILKKNNLLEGGYIEPFAGGSGIAWFLLINGYVWDVYLNDLDKAIYSFWYSVINHPDELCKLIETTPITIQEWHKQKAVQSKKNSTILELGFSTLFLNRTNRSGILKAGVIGGLDQSGPYKIDCRFNRRDLIKKICRISQYKNRVHLYQDDALEFLNNTAPKIRADSLIYLDPPYYKKGAMLYENFYGHNDHVKISEAVSALKQKWFVTYDNTPEIKAIYNNYTQRSLYLNYTAHTKRRGSELLIFREGAIEMPSLT